MSQSRAGVGFHFWDPSALLLSFPKAPGVFEPPIRHARRMHFHFFEYLGPGLHAGGFKRPNYV